MCSTLVGNAIGSLSMPDSDKKQYNYLIVKKPTLSNSGNTTQKFKRSSVTVALKLDTDGLKSVNLMDLSLICISSETVFLTFALIFNFQPKFQ